MRSRIAIWLLVLPLVFAAALPAQQRLATLTKGKLTAVLDTYSGRFAAQTVNGTRLLFARDAELTSHISISLDGEIYTNYPKSDLNVLWPQHALGRGETQMLSDRIRHTWRLGSRGGERRVILELEPVSDSLYNEVRIHLMVENATTYVISAGMTVMMDVCAGADDKVRLRDGATALEYERRFASGELSDRLMLMSGVYQPDSAYCRLGGDALTPPDAVTVGRWMYHSALGTAVYGYEASGLPIWDSAVLAQWDTATLPAGKRRTQSTAAGVTGRLPQSPGLSGTFAREFVVPVITQGLLTIVSDSVSTVHISTPFVDRPTESIDDHDRSWDTTLTVGPGNPSTIFMRVARYSPKDVDSIAYRRQSHIEVTSDIGIGLITRAFRWGYEMDAVSVWPVSWWDSECLFHGIMGFGSSEIFTATKEDTINIRTTIGYQINWYAGQSSPTFTEPGSSIIYGIPSRASLFLHRGTYEENFNHWSTRKPETNALTADGVGDLVTCQNPFRIQTIFRIPILPGKNNPHIGKAVHNRVIDHPSRRQLGATYVFVPFFKPRARKQDDLLRIIAYENDTKITLTDGTPPIVLDRAQYVDTLFSSATIIRSDKPVAVYQHHLSWEYLESDTVYGGAAFAMLPPELWGNRYHAMTNDIFAPNLGYSNGKWDLPVFPLYYDNLYLIVVTHTSNRAGVLINDVPVDAGRFTVFGEYAYAYIDIAPGYHIVSSSRPLLTVVCGGGAAIYGGESKLYPAGMSWIPPFTSSTEGTGPIHPKIDEREGKRETYIPRD